MNSQQSGSIWSIPAQHPEIQQQQKRRKQKKRGYLIVVVFFALALLFIGWSLFVFGFVSRVTFSNTDKYINQMQAMQKLDKMGNNQTFKTKNEKPNEIKDKPDIEVEIVAEIPEPEKTISSKKNLKEMENQTLKSAINQDHDKLMQTLEKVDNNQTFKTKNNEEPNETKDKPDIEVEIVAEIPGVEPEKIIPSKQNLKEMENQTLSSAINQEHNKLQGDKNAEIEIATEIPGIELQIPSSEPNQPPIHIVYAPPTTSSPKGLALLLHACGHSALKFFSPYHNNSATNSTNSNSCTNCCPTCTPCTECIGLSEELRMVRLLLERGYLPIAISCMDQTRRCWLPQNDENRIHDVLNHELFVEYEKVIAIGASIGGSMAAHLLDGRDRKRVRAAVVMVMDLRSDIIFQLKRMTKKPKIYFAPMPREKERLQKVIANYEELDGTAVDPEHHFVLDTTSCVALPVTIPFLLSRVPGLTQEAATTLIEQLAQNGHMDPSTHMLLQDPTRSDWRDVIEPNKNRYWLNTYDLKRGHSPLAKALHRAWAYHEYCSDVIVPALDFFEKEW